MMSGHHYAQATSEESTELVTNRANVKPLHWNAATAGYDEQPSFESQSSANLVSNFSNLQLSSQNSSFIAPVSSHYSQFSGGATHFPNVHSESHVSQNREIAETQHPAVPDQHLRVEKNRLNTFNGRWPRSSVVQPRDLAKAGFYYVGVDDVVRCVFCLISLKAWEPGDVPLNEHRKHSPSCPFVLQQDVGNVPLQNTQLQSPTDTFPLEWRTMFQHQHKPARPEYADAYNRLRSFTGRTLPAGQTADALANAGFFYTGPEDNVKCYWCGGCLKAWQPTDQPMVEHLRWFPDCWLSQQQQLDSSAQSAWSGDTRNVLGNSQLHHPVTASSEDNCISDESIVVSQPVEQEMELAEDETGSETGGSLHSTLEQPGQPRESRVMESLKEENRRLKDTMLCKICMDEAISTLFLPCSHLVCCDGCAPTLRECPICRTAIRGTVRTYIS